MNPAVIRPAPPEVEGFSYEEFVILCEKNPDLDFERTASGTLYLMPPTYSETSVSESEIARHLGNWNAGLTPERRGKVLGPSARIFLPNGASYCPDAAWVAPETWQDYQHRGGKFAQYAPDFVIEIRSPSDRLPSLHFKMKEWMDGGVRLGWLLDPQDKQAWVFRPGQPDPTYYDNFETVLSGEEVLPGFELNLSALLA